MQSSTPSLSQVLSLLLTMFFSFSWSRPVLDSCCFVSTRVDSCWLVPDSCWLVLIRVDSYRTLVDSCWLVLICVDSCWLVLICVDSCWLVSDSCWPVLIRVDSCWYSCIRIDLIFFFHIWTLQATLMYRYR